MSPRPDERSEDGCEDGDSLFGSPPPSPHHTGRMDPPGQSTNTGSNGSRPSTATVPARNQINVGTIALPGSQPDSEFPINPLALSLSLGIVQRPPAPQPMPAAAPAHTPSSMGGDARASTSQSFNGPSGRPPKPKKKPKKSSSARSSKESTPQPRMPEFILPEPGAPPPPNFLRNQENLLGRAGKVAGVKPSTLTHMNPHPHSNTHTRGSTPSNPILVDEDDTPRLGRRSSFSPGFTDTSTNNQPYIDPALLTAPTNQEIVAVLIGQKDIFPILEGVLKLVVGNVPGGKGVPEKPKPTGFERKTGPASQQQQTPSTTTNSTSTSNQPASAPPKKRRKLSRVPAGATDWDVPYPFEQGEGPDSYRSTWERERGKQLIGQLIKLIKSAARKAATKKYLSQKEKEEKERQKKEAEEDKKRKRNGYYRVDGLPIETQTHRPEHHAEHGHQCGQVYDVLQDTSNALAGHIQPSALSTANPNAYTQPNNVLDTAGTQDQHIPTLEELFSPCHSTALDSPMDFSLFNSYPDELSHSSSLGPFNSVSSTSSTNINNNVVSHPGASSSTTTAVSTATSQTTTDMDQAAFDSWMNFLVDTFPTSFDANNNVSAATNPNTNFNSDAPHSTTNASATQTHDILNNLNLGASNSASHCSTPGPDEFSFASLFAGLGGGTTGGTGMGSTGIGDYDLTAMLAAIMNQPPDVSTCPSTGAGAVAAATVKEGRSSKDTTAPPPIEDQMIDPTLLALSLPSISSSNLTPTNHHANPGHDSNAVMHVVTSTPTLASLPSSITSASTSPVVSGSGSGSGNDPATPVSAGWDLSLPDVHIVGTSSGEGMASGNGPDWERSNASNSASATMDVDGGEDFGYLPDADVDVHNSDGHMTKTSKVDKGKGRAIDLDASWTPTSTLTPLSTNANTRMNTPAPPSTTSVSALADASAAFRTLLGGSISSAALNSLAPTPADATFTPSATVANLESSRLKRKARKDDIIARAKEKRRRLQEELDKMKMKLWETTIEQAALVHLKRMIDEDEKKATEGVHVDSGAGDVQSMEVTAAESSG